MKKKKARRFAQLVARLEQREKRAGELGVSPGRVLMMEIAETNKRRQLEAEEIAKVTAARIAQQSERNSRWGGGYYSRF